MKEGIPDAVVVDEEGNIEIDHTSMDVRLSRTVSSKVLMTTMHAPPKMEAPTLVTSTTRALQVK